MQNLTTLDNVTDRLAVMVSGAFQLLKTHALVSFNSFLVICCRKGIYILFMKKYVSNFSSARPDRLLDSHSNLFE